MTAFDSTSSERDEDSSIDSENFDSTSTEGGHLSLFGVCRTLTNRYCRAVVRYLDSVAEPDGVHLDELVTAVARIHSEGTDEDNAITAVEEELLAQHLPHLEQQRLVRAGEVRQDDWKVREGSLFGVGCRLLDDIEAIAPRTDAADVVRERILPEWAQDFAYPVVVRPSRSSTVVHAPDPSSDMPAPACSPAKETGQWKMKERAVFGTFRRACRRPPCATRIRLMNDICGDPLDV